MKEYYLFDPEREFFKPPLKGFQLVAGQFVPMEANEAGDLVSPELGLRLTVERHLLRLVDPATGHALPMEEEYEEQFEEALREAEEAQREAEEAQREVEEAQRQAEEAKREAEAERRRAAILEAEIARLRASLPPDDKS